MHPEDPPYLGRSAALLMHIPGRIRRQLSGVLRRDGQLTQRIVESAEAAVLAE